MPVFLCFVSLAPHATLPVCQLTCLKALYMYRNLGVQWATTVLGFIALALMPVPLLFFIYGARIRKLSKFVPKLPPGMGPGGPPGAGLPPLVLNAGSKGSTLGSETTPSTLVVSEKV